jgi:polar amino acid transport system substrate-binding protein
MFFRRILLSAAVAASASFSALTHAEPLRVCADPDNLPFSSEGKERGMYVELAELVGERLSMPVQYTWWFTHMQRRAIRNTIQKDECDTMFALPADADYRARGVQKSKPFMDVGYVLVSKPGLAFTSLESLKGKRIAVQFSSTPHIVLSTMEGFTTVTLRTPEEIFAVLDKGEADVGFLWGPVAGYDNKHKHQGRWLLTPVAGHKLAGQVVVGVRADKGDLKARIDQALDDLQPQIRSLAEKYGFPTAKPVNLERSSSIAVAPRTAAHAGSDAPAARIGDASSAFASARAVPATGWVAVAESEPSKKKSDVKKAATKQSASPAAAGAAVVTAPAATAAPKLDPEAQAGRVRFNDQCSHCHGSDGASPIRERDVRRLSMRYDADKWRDVATTTIKNGRSDLGMPPWKDSLGEKEIKELLAFLATVQK